MSRNNRRESRGLPVCFLSVIKALCIHSVLQLTAIFSLHPPSRATAVPRQPKSKPSRGLLRTLGQSAVVPNDGSCTHLVGPTLSTRNNTTTMTHTALRLGAFALSTVFCRKTKALCSITIFFFFFFTVRRHHQKRGLSGIIGRAPHLAQQTLQLSLEVAVLALERLVLAQRHFQASLQREQVLLLLLPGQGRRLAVLDHALLPLGDLRLQREGVGDKTRN